ncbi:MAG TPA: flagellar assembly protein A [Sideroxyarcus sp.]|nr:flagellar assembly protein A [Sideroxyarcus sp.]
MAESQAAADFRQAGLPLPGYLQRQPGGIFVDLANFPVGGGFAQFIDRLFGEGARFAGLDYCLFSGLLYDYDAILDAHGLSGKVRLAADVVEFTPQRRALYKAVKVEAESSSAMYLFEPAMIEVETEVPVYGEPDPDGVAPIIGSAKKVELKPTQLDLDEFVADMWLKGVRFGIAVDAVAGVIARRETVRMEVATRLDATEGSDAEIEEVCDALRRDNSPKRLANGKADLRKYQNRFPQIAKDVRLLKKKKRVLGKPGFRVDGAMIEPPIPEDFDLSAMAGDGTRVETVDGAEYIVSNRDGFLSLDMATNHIAITEKIENKGGVSVRTTGDLSLTGNDFVEHGEVQEGRIVEGKNMTFRSDVYGDIVSQGGSVLLEKNLSGGSARCYGGEITSNGRTLNSVIEARDGRVALKYAESCLIMGETVAVEQAVNCEIVATNVELGAAEGCAIAGKTVGIGSSAACRGRETLVSMLVPDLSGVDGQIGQVYKAIDDCNRAIAAKDQAQAQLLADDEFAKFLALAKSIRQGVVKLNAAQQEGWQKMAARFAGNNKALAGLEAEMRVLREHIAALQEELAYLLESRRKSGAGIHCAIKAVAGDTLVRTMVACFGVTELRKMKAVELKLKLREQGAAQERVFFNDEGSLDWSYVLPEMIHES